MFCTDIPAPFFLVFSSSTPHLLYYSHIPAVFAAIVFGLFIYSKTRTLASRLLLTVIGLFSAWILIDLIVWTNVDSRIIMLAWSVMNLAAILIAVFLLYFSYVFLKEKDSPFWTKVLAGALVSPFTLMIPTKWNIEGFDLAACEAVQSPLALHFFYFLQAFFILWTASFFVGAWRNASAPEDRKKTAFLGFGVSFFLLSFYGGSFAAGIIGNWEVEQYGLFGVFMFIGALIGLIVRYRAFDVRMLGAQALVFALVVLIASQFFFVKTTINLILTGVTLFITSVAGYFLIRSVKDEVKRKEELQEIATKLAVANEELRKLDNTKSEFISIASHQLRTPLTAIKGFLSLVLEGSYGKISAEVEDVLNKVYSANNHLVELVENLLSISRIESGRIQYQFASGNIVDILHELSDAFSVVAKGRRLDLSFVYPEALVPPFLMDFQKIREVISNMIDNAIKYTQQGGVTVRLSIDGKIVRVAVSDTGVGIAPEDLAVLFQKFRRGKESGKVNVSGTGLGLYVGKSFAEAHGGRIFIESDGVGKGSTFILELPFRTKGNDAGAGVEGA